MKLKNIFKLYKSYYPSAEPYRVTIAGCGAVQVSCLLYSSDAADD